MEQPGSKQPRSSRSMGISIGAAVLIGIGLPYIYINYLMHSSGPPPPPKKPATRPAPPPPPKLDYLGASKNSGKEASLKKDGVEASTDLAPDDAMVVWLKAEQPANGAGGAGGRGGGGGRGGRIRLPLTLKDAAGNDYSFSVERKDAGLMALHIKRGYAKAPGVLTLQEDSQGKTLGSWKIDGLPAPHEEVADSAVTSPAPGEVRLQKGSRGPVQALLYMNKVLPNDQGFILKPVAASYTPIVTEEPEYLLSALGGSPYDNELQIPNATMAKRVQFDMATFTGVKNTETVTFHTAHVETPFGHPTFVVDGPETVTSPSGLKITLEKQNNGPRRETKAKIHPAIAIRLSCDAANMQKYVVNQAAPGIYAELVQPSAASLGLKNIRFEFLISGLNGEMVFPSTSPQPAEGVQGTFKTGPVPVVLRLTITKPKILSTQKLVLPVNPKIEVEAQPQGQGR